ncbi:MAG: endonuclease/exonuclease/phosphatase family protein [Actinomycetales bacterium]|nr:endonuclease/exonuclease/phosphatase family protein [Actinomycetales bacterium]
MWSVTTVNVNGIRAAHRRGGLTWLAEHPTTVLCLQEVRATHEQVHATLADSPLAHWQVAHVPAPELGRAGVAILTEQPPLAARTSVRQPLIDGQGRWVEVDVDSPFGVVTVVSVYVHSGEAETPRQEEKYRFLAGMDARLRTLHRRAQRTGGHVVVCGDLNIAHREVDLKNWRANRASAGFLPQERAWLDTWFERSWVDLGRRLGGPGPGPYTWWSWRGRGFDTDGGWRIDYVLATPGLAAHAQRIEIGRAASYAERWSDHAAVTAYFA